MTTYSGIYYKALENLAIGNIVWKSSTGSTFKCALSVTTGPTQTDDDYTDLGTDELANATGGYDRPGTAMTVISAAYGATYVVFDADNVTWPTFSATAQWAHVYVDSSTDWLWSVHDFGSAKQGGGGNYTVQWSDNGVSRISITALA